MLLSTSFNKLSFRFLRGISSSLPFVLHQHPPTCSTKCLNENSHDSREETLISLFKSCSTMRELSQIHAQIISAGFDQHVYVIGRLISFCCVSENGSMDYASLVFEQLNWPDGFLYNTMIRGLGRVDRDEDALLFFKRMRERGKAADNFTFAFLLKICGHMTAVELGRQIHCCIVKHGLESNVYVCNTLIHMYGLFREISAASQVFEEITSRDLVSWNTLIDVYVSCGEYKEALRMFLRMRRDGFNPDEATLVVTLSACSELGALDFGRWVHSNTIHQTVSVSNSLIDMYAKCGAIESALRVFDNMASRNIVSWNSMILGLALHGHVNKALLLFNKMLEECEFQEPNDITFLGVLCSCSHGGLVEEGRMYFNMMRRDYGVTPNIKHYGCMVDLLGKAGLLQEAYELVRSMPMEGNAVVWRTLLGACRVHGNIELGQRVLEHLRELEPDHSSDYVLLSHMYAGAGRWNDMLHIREVMRGRGVQKPEPGLGVLSCAEH
ncbi:pentatricopeptide repeat-containing protein At1g59720, chloroplastic/mitochondrial-like [Ananas comosus]|uniref:Pentatricopeptide repeat-containing protein At1g59720, chloroplastic/mitochondrial-like n=1 Tax=Ananas comosus TaxID=4615 RepID=A0A6P5EQ49_ANACO|nr:pentatricopeptide repeat-containing protein At1g59720, chloroplastic/mitochondrial-like [Ananas comosus]XP_020083381.1 pentatricopeptide repeat-containing protein At1g59720, chloroplastic/mitochondrial-like [Ananas comosus]XP_020083382.1 pentatricopeptide repeat-containing protein At1g59720, chloroplastic/mitochondrial-like [Ananas comosus]XP_020083383.1 pentatricopeptide repeat-containing protein At1g59720, chloroplastic/mitochondrial-like [Ananas comosus]